MTYGADVEKFRHPGHPIDPQFPNRWSPRAMTGEPITDDELMTLFEAARWAPSSYNNQPWRFVYARRDTPHWDRLFGLLIKFNQQWCKNAAALCVVCSKTTFDHNGKPAVTHAYDAGAAWMSLALQGLTMGLVVHGMQGFDYERARAELGLPDDVVPQAMAALGHPAPADTLPGELRKMEEPNGRRPLSETVFEGRFTGS